MGMLFTVCICAGSECEHQIHTVRNGKHPQQQHPRSDKKQKSLMFKNKKHIFLVLKFSTYKKAHIAVEFILSEF